MTNADCPYCGHYFDIETWETRPDNEYRAQCPKCGEEFVFSWTIEISGDSRKGTKSELDELEEI